MKENLFRKKKCFMGMLVNVTLALSIFSDIPANAAQTENTIVYNKDFAPKAVRELTNLNTENTKVYQMSDGSKKYEIYADDVNYEDKNGKCREIDNSIQQVANNTDKKQGYVYENGDNLYDVKFGLDQKDPVVDIGYEQNNFSIKYDATAQCELNECEDLGRMECGKYAKDESSVIYEDAGKNVDIVYKVSNDTVKEDIILNRKPESNEFTFTIETSDLAVKEKNGILYFYDKNNQLVCVSEKLFMVDANGKYCYAIAVELSQVDKDTYSMKLVLDNEFLNASDTAYPVYVDPSYTTSNKTVSSEAKIIDTFVSAKKSSKNYNTGSQKTNLRTGWNKSLKTCHSFLKFKYDIPSSETVTSAKLQLTKKNGSDSMLVARRCTSSWDKDTLTYNNMPQVTSVYSAQSAFSGGVATFDVTKCVQMWGGNAWKNHGFCISDTQTIKDGSDWTTFYSSDSSDMAKIPKLVITTGKNSNAFITSGSSGVYARAKTLKINNAISSAAYPKVYAKVNKAIAAWNKHSNKTGVKMVNSNNSNNKINVSTDTNGCLGLYTARSYSNGDYSCNVTLYVNAMKNSSEYVSSNYYQSVAVHELGHALGLNDLSPNNGVSDETLKSLTVMGYGRNRNAVINPKWGDIIGVKKAHE